MDDNLTIEQAAKELNVSRSHIYRLIDRGQLTVIRNPLFRKGARVQIPREQIDSLKKL